MFDLKPLARTFVASLNTDGQMLRIGQGDEDRVASVIADWEKQMGMRMERTEIVGHRQLNINSYIQLIRGDDGEIEVKSKGHMAHDPGLGADHNNLIVNRAIVEYMMHGTDVAVTIQGAADRREILLFTAMLMAQAGDFQVDGVATGKVLRVYRSTIGVDQLPRIVRPGTEKKGESTVGGGCAVLQGIEWPAEDDVDVSWYIARARQIIVATDVLFSPHHNRIALQLAELGLNVAGWRVDPKADALVKESGVWKVPEPAPDSWIEKKVRRNLAGDRGLVIRLTQKGKAVAMAPEFEHPDSFVMTWGTVDGDVMGAIHDRARIDRNVLRKAAKEGKLIELAKGKSYVVVFDSLGGIVPLTMGSPLLSVELGDDLDDGVVEGEAQGAAGTVVTNARFMEQMFGEELPNACVASLDAPADSQKADWTAGPTDRWKGEWEDPVRQNYLCVSTFNVQDKGDGRLVYHRRKDRFRALHMVMLDDVGTKVQVNPRDLGFGEPTAIIETSPGNCQWLYRLSVPVTDQVAAEFMMGRMLHDVQGVALSDKGAKGVTRLAKLPVGMNLKQSLPEPFVNRVVAWNPGVSYHPDEIAGWCGAVLRRPGEPEVTGAAGAAHVARVVDGVAGDQVGDHPLTQCLENTDLMKTGVVDDEGWMQITCPWVEGHTKAVDTGSKVRLRVDGSWAFYCHHGHCEGRGAAELFAWLREQGEDPSGYKSKGAGSGAVRKIDRSRLQFDDVDRGGDDGRDDDDRDAGDLDGGSAVQVVMGFSQPGVDGGGARARRADGGEGRGRERTPVPVMSVAQMLERFVLIGDGQLVGDTGGEGSAWPIKLSDFRGIYAASVTPQPRGRPLENTDLWFRDRRRDTTSTATHHPGAGVITESPDGRRAFNTWRPKPLVEVAGWQEHAKVFEDHVRYLFDDRAADFMDWVAHIEQSPGEQVSSGWLHINRKTGTGREWLARAMALVWPGDVANNLDLTKLLSGRFNEEVGGKTLAVVDEVQEGMGDGKGGKFAMAEALKSAITADVMWIDKKWGAKLPFWNRTRWLICSNHESALKLDQSDRRFNIVVSEATPKSEGYYVKLYGLLKDPLFAPSVRFYLAQRDISRFRPGARPKMTEAKVAVLEVVKNPYDRILEEVIKVWPADLIHGTELDCIFLGELGAPPSGFTTDRIRSEMRVPMKYAKSRLGVVEFGKRRFTAYSAEKKAPRIQGRVYVLRNHSIWLPKVDTESSLSIAETLRAGRDLEHLAIDAHTYFVSLLSG